jgi:hypothetical protein
MLLITVARADERLKVNNTFVLFLPQSVSAISSARSGNGISFEKTVPTMFGELEDVMSAVGSAPVSNHPLGLLVSPKGRFPECINCRLRFEFPARAQYDTITKPVRSLSLHLHASQPTHKSLSKKLALFHHGSTHQALKLTLMSVQFCRHNARTFPDSR